MTHRLKYLTFVGDGDSSTYKAVCQIDDGYGPYNVPITKEECVNHVSKRLGTRLRKFKKEASKYITIKSGKRMRQSMPGGAHMLMDETIKHLSRYLGKAIHNNVGTNHEAMRKAIWASFFHLTSTGNAPGHILCSAGPTSWCFYNRAKAIHQRNCTCQEYPGRSCSTSRKSTET